MNQLVQKCTKLQLEWQQNPHIEKNAYISVKCKSSVDTDAPFSWKAGSRTTSYRTFLQQIKIQMLATSLNERWGSPES